jgi:hypothetical protein
MLINSSVFPALSCTSFKVSGLILRFLIHIEFILIQGERHGCSFSFLHADIHFSKQHLLKRLSFLHGIFCLPLLKNQLGVSAWNHIWVFYSILLTFISVFMPVPSHFYCYGSAV